MDFKQDFFVFACEISKSIFVWFDVAYFASFDSEEKRQEQNIYVCIRSAACFFFTRLANKTLGLAYKLDPHLVETKQTIA